MAALIEIMPLSSPMVSITGTGFVVPVKLARCAAATNAYRSVPVGRISTYTLTPPITPTKVNNPPVFLKEPGGMVVVKVPTESVTASVTGLIPLLAVLLKVKLDSRAKASWFALRSKAIWSLALKARKGTPTGGGMIATPTGSVPTMMTVGSTVLLPVSITETVLSHAFAT